jgi:uncharacterized protein YaaW (UPF0174 family)
MTKEEWQGVEDSTDTRLAEMLAREWEKMKAEHAKELAELQIKNSQAVIRLVAVHMADRDELRSLLKK